MGDCENCVLKEVSRYKAYYRPQLVAVCTEQRRKLEPELTLLERILFTFFSEKISRETLQEMLEEDFEFEGYMLNLRGEVRSKQEALDEDKEQLINFIKQTITTLIKLKEEKDVSTTDIANAIDVISNFIDYAERFKDKHLGAQHTTDVSRAIKKIKKLKNNEAGYTYRPWGPDKIPALTSFNPDAYLKVLSELKAKLDKGENSGDTSDKNEILDDDIHDAWD